LASLADYIPALTRLGLTEYEAKIYATLIKTGPKTAGELSFLSGVPRTKLYGSVRGLERKGLVKVLNQKPESFTAISPNDVLLPLAEKLIKEAEQNLEQIQSLALTYESLKLFSGKRTFLKTDLLALEGRSTISENLTRLLSKSNESITLMASANGIVRLYRSHFKIIEQAVLKRVKVRLIAPVTTRNASVAKEIVNILQFKALPKLNFQAVIVDSSTILLIEAIPDDFDDYAGSDVGILTENPQIINGFNRLYDLTWAVLPNATEVLRNIKSK